MKKNAIEKKLLKMAIEIVDVPIKMVIFHSHVNVYQRVIPSQKKRKHILKKDQIDQSEYLGLESFS